MNESQRDCEDIKDKSAVYERYEAPYEKKGKKAAWREHADEDGEAMDSEQHIKKDCPPRFSTLFESKPGPVPVIHQYEEPRPRRGGGMFLSWPAVILLGLLLFFETVALFAYTAIGLYNNMPRHMLTQGHSSTAALDVVGSAGQAPVNIAPNFVIGGGEHVTVTVTTTIFLPTPAGMHTVETASQAGTGMAALASDLRDLLRPSTSSTTTSIPVVTVTPGGGTATSVVFVTHSEDPVKSADRPTSFVTQFVAPSVLSAQQAAMSIASKAFEAAKEQVSSSTSSSAASSTTSSSTSSSSSSTSTADTTTSSVPTNTASGKGTLGVCFGGAGAVFQNCV